MPWDNARCTKQRSVKKQTHEIRGMWRNSLVKEKWRRSGDD